MLTLIKLRDPEKTTVGIVSLNKQAVSFLQQFIANICSFSDEIFMLKCSFGYRFSVVQNSVTLCSQYFFQNFKTLFSETKNELSKTHKTASKTAILYILSSLVSVK